MATVDDVTPVGNYAMCIAWGDGHDTGIYTFANLLELAARLGDIPDDERTISAK